MVFLFFISLLSMIWASSRVVTDFVCEVDEKYGSGPEYKDGLRIDQGLFYFACSTENRCYAEGKHGERWATCGFSWKDVDSLTDNSMVIVDVKTWSHDQMLALDAFDGGCYDGYKRALSFDAFVGDAIDTQGNHGARTFWFCYRKKSWAEAKRTQTEVVVDISAEISSSFHASGVVLRSYWDWGNCGPDGDDANWNICGYTAFNCPDMIDFKSCPTGKAVKYRELGTGECCSSVTVDGCHYAYYTEYVCEDDSEHGFELIGQWPAGKAHAIGDDAQETDRLYLFSKKEHPRGIKVIGSWTFSNAPRKLSAYDYKITKKADAITSDEMTQEDYKTWGNEISESHSVEVAVQAEMSYMFASGSLSAAYGYEYGHAKNQQFENQLKNIASNTFSQTTEVTYSFTIPKQEENQPISSNIWYFQTQVISGDLEAAVHYKLDSGLEVHGCGYHVAPNCLPGYCAPYDPHCWTCSEDWAIIDPNFTSPPECGDKGEGCDWVALPRSECPDNSDLAEMEDCNEGMVHGEMCEADSPLPHGRLDENGELEDFNINNCGWYDVFIFKCD